MKRYFPAARWPTSLKVISLLGTVMLCAIGYGAYLSIPTRDGFTHDAGIGVSFIPVAMLFGALLSAVRGYSVDGHSLAIHRLITTTRIPLAGLVRVWCDPTICKGSLRVVGNGGLYSFTGIFSNRLLGRYRLFATDIRKAVVLRWERKVVVISPEGPKAFIEFLGRLNPHLEPGILE